MTHVVYNTIAKSLMIGVLAALVIAILSFVAMILRWRTPRRRRHVIRLLLSLAAVPCFIGIQQGILRLVVLPAIGREMTARYNEARAARLADSSFVHVGDAVPDFAVTDADGERFSMSDAKGKVVLINFFATWCGPCQMELPHLNRIWNSHRDSAGFRMLVIGREESMETVREFRSKNRFSFPIAPDPERKVYSLFAKELVPRTLVVSPNGTVVYSKAGFFQDDLAELETVLSAQFAVVR
jgi:peroxiredoxin